MRHSPTNTKVYSNIIRGLQAAPKLFGPFSAMENQQELPRIPLGALMPVPT